MPRVAALTRETRNNAQRPQKSRTREISRDGGSTPQKRTKARSLSGCSTCRARKVKCDLRRPICSQCEKRRVNCGGFEAKIQYLLYDATQDTFRWPNASDEASEGSSRRPLFTEDQRAAMSADVTHAVRGRDLDEILDELDNGLSTNQYFSSSQYVPFDIFSTNQEVADHPSSKSTPTDHSPGEESRSLFSTLGTDSASTITRLPAVPEHDQLFSAFDAPPITDAQFQLILANDSSLSHGILGTAFAESSSGGTYGDIFGFDPLASFSTQLPWSFQIDPQTTIPSQASFLLDHYKLQMIKLFSPKGSQKPPWAVLHLPSAVSTMSELTLWGKTSHAKTSLFYSLLSVSAFGIDRINLTEPGATDYWWSIGDGLRERAKQELKHALASELAGPKKSKYKELLMAVLTMVTISVVSGRQNEARSFLIDAEHLICIRGIPKPKKSRKVRMLHHIYLFLRIIEESTHVYPELRLDDTSKPTTVGITSAGLSLFPSLGTNSTREGKNIDIITGKSFEMELIGKSSEEASLFGEIYGVPISLLSLISQATFLANEMERTKCDYPISSNDPNLEQNVQNLEDAIHSWQWETADSESVFEEDQATNQKILQHLILAIHNALVVYFYRRIHNLHPRALQSYVMMAIDHLAECDQEKIKYSVIYNGIAWPGFIAATEALDPYPRHRVIQWLRDSAQSSGFRNFDLAADVAEQIWVARANGRPRMSWVDLVRENELTLVLT